MFAAVYQDEGPSGISAQSMSLTSPWFKMYLFDTADEAREFAKNIGTLESRRRPRWTIASTVEDDGYHELVDHSLQIPDIVERCMNHETEIGRLEAKINHLEAEIVGLRVRNDNLRSIDRGCL
jgi:hypothetical protein